MEANGYAARLAGLERVTERQDRDISRSRDDIAVLKTVDAVQDTRIKGVEDDQEQVNVRIDKLTRAFWAAAATFGSLTLTGLSIIVVLLAGGQ